MDIREKGFINGIDEDIVPDCILDEDVDSYFMLADLDDFNHVVYALCFFSGPEDNPSAKSYVFYFYRDEKIDVNKRPDDIMTFKVRFKYPDRIHQIDQYLGGTAFGTINAPPLAVREHWYPGWMSQDGKQEIKAIQAGHFQAASPTTVRSYQFPDPEKEKLEAERAILAGTEMQGEGVSKTISSTKVYGYIAVGAFLLWLLSRAC